MPVIKFSICKDPNEEIEPYEMAILPFIDQSQGQNVVRFQSIPWANHQQDIKDIALDGKNIIDVSQVPSTTVNDLIAMDALRPFTQREIVMFGGISAFPPVAWNSLGDTKEIYAIPWIIDTRALIYRREMLEQAGIDEMTAFASFDNMENTFERLQEKGFETPWAISTGNRYQAFQTACTWIWGLGGEIGKGDEILIDRPEAIEALVRYFKLYRFMPQQGQNPDQHEIWDMFQERKVTTIMTNVSIRSLSRTAGTGSNTGAALAPGPTYVGGSSLVIWRHSRQPEQAVELIRQLTTSNVQLQFALLSGSMPARSKVLNDTHFTETPKLRVFLDSISQGRTYAGLPACGLIDDLFSTAIANVWAKIIANPRIDIKSTLLSEIEPAILRIKSSKV